MACTKTLIRLWHDEWGVTSVEYALLLALVAVAGITAFASLSTEVNVIVEHGSDALRDATGMGCSSH